MIQNQGLCPQVGHEDFCQTHICTFLNCDQQTRWACVKCIQSKLHSHGFEAQNHVLNKQNIIKYCQQLDSKASLEQKIQSQITQMRNIVKQLLESLDNIQQYLQQRSKTKQYIISMVGKNFSNIRNEDLQMIIPISKQNVLIKSNIQLIKNNTQLLIGLTQDIEQLQEDQNLKKNINFINYMEINEYAIIDAQISNNEKLLATTTYNSIKIYDLIQKNLIRDILIPEDPWVILFSQDSSLIYCGCCQKIICSIEVNKQFRLNNYNLSSFTDDVKRYFTREGDMFRQITEIQRNVIICGTSDQIIKYNLEKKEFLFDIKPDKYYEYFQYHKENDIILVQYARQPENQKQIQIYSGQDGKQKLSINFSYDMKNFVILNNNRLAIEFGRHNEQIQLIRFDYQEQNFENVRSFQYDKDNQIFYSALENNFVQIFRKKICLLDEDLNLIKESTGDYDFFAFNYHYFPCAKQLQTFNYLTSIKYGNLFVIKKQLR